MTSPATPAHSLSAREPYHVARPLRPTARTWGTYYPTPEAQGPSLAHRKRSPHTKGPAKRKASPGERGDGTGARCGGCGALTLAFRGVIGQVCGRMGTDIEVSETPERWEPGPHGGMLNRSGRRPSASSRRAIRAARRDLFVCLKRMQEIRDDPHSKADEVIKACLGILRLSGADRDKPRATRRLNLSVTRATPAEQAAKLSASTTPALPAPQEPTP